MVDKPKNTQQVLSQWRDAEDAFFAIKSADQRFKENIKTLTHRELDNKADEMLRNVPVDRFVKLVPRLSASVLTKEGVKNAYDVRSLLESYRKVDGIGDVSRSNMRAALNELIRSQKADQVIRFDVTSRSNSQTKLLKELYKLKIAQRIMKSLGQLTEISYRSLDDVRREITPGIWLFKGTTAKQAVVDATNKYEKYLQSGEIKQLHESANELTDLERVDGEAVWDDFDADAAGYYALLEDASGMQGTTAGKDSILDSETIKAVEDWPLDESLIKSSLRGWQRFGAKYILKYHRVLLGDEMGLGKTIQALAVMADSKSRGGTHFLVVVPASVITNWQRETEKHTKLKPVVIHGSQKFDAYRNWINNGGVGITNYETMRALDLTMLPFIDVMVVDEAQNIKNPGSQRSIATYTATESANIVLFMSGTPLENRLDEMLVLLRKLRPDRESNLVRDGYYHDPEKFRRGIADIYLRRKQEDVLNELPPKTQTDEWVDFGTEQVEIYRQALQNPAFMKLRQVGWQGNDKDNQKLIRTLELVDEAIENGQKVIIFSYFRNVLMTLQRVLGSKTLEPITGGVSVTHRQEIVDTLSNDESKSVLLAQVVAGGVGLNIQAASVVIFAEPQIKPSLEAQAIARAQRMGQTRPVFVYRMLNERSVDERIVQLLETKQTVFDVYADRSVAADENDEATSITEGTVVKEIIEEERKRYNVG
ncbi:DEAD/DEAH box helicase [Weissella confusa]|uniref:DEAD/DEAH box helicase n=1 Tax=Weissella confusa TaxID=1583 RepID=UPI0021A6648B|nr:DEAD/DEAH box helicase [Weissella confusa]MCT2910896.1 DEAD/DEAH box helicase [Weissella confusa]